jgi:hypothetical protein
VKGHLCWNPTEVGRMATTEAESFSDSMFLATHSPLKVRRYQFLPPPGGVGVGTLEDLGRMTEQEVLDAFLNAESFFFMPVLGQSGTGKTHLIRWLATKIKSNEHRRVIRIPRLGISLRGVIDRIIEGMPGEEFDKVRRHLKEGLDNISFDQTKHYLLDFLAVAVGPNGGHGIPNRGSKEEAVQNALPNLFNDPVFRKLFLAKDGFIHRVAHHLSESASEADILENPIAFTFNDLPSNVPLTTLKQASLPAKQAYNALQSAEIREAAVEWIRRHHQKAIRQVMRLGGTNLQDLMTLARRELAKSDVELVLLIEDLARLQGIELELLEALLEQPKPGSGLCKMRTALACTKGFYEALPDTVKTRAHLHLAMDDPGTDKGGFGPTDVQRFVSRYLNAFRLGGTDLADWYGEQTVDEGASDLPNACSACKHRESCHGAFGNIDGIGLYPFNPTAIDRIKQRISGERFVARKMIMDGMLPVLRQYATDIPDGRFPSSGLMKAMCGPKLPVEFIQQLHTKYGQDANRYSAIADLWSKANSITDVASGVYEAFKLGAPQVHVAPGGTLQDAGNVAIKRDVAAGTTESAITAVTPVGTGSSAISPVLAATNQRYQAPQGSSALDELDAWGRNEKRLSLTVAGELRDLLFRAIVAEIDLPTLMMQGSKVAHETTGTLRKNSIIFEDQVGNEVAPSGVLLKIGIGAERRVAAVAMRALLRRRDAGNWEFDGGSLAYRTAATQIERWADMVVRNLRGDANPDNPIVLTQGGRWSPLPVAVELLTMGQMFMGRVPAGETDGQIMKFLFEPFPESLTPNRCQEWQDVALHFIGHGREVREKVLATAACVKGYGGGVSMIDASVLLGPARKVLSSCTVSADVPGQLPVFWADLGQLHSRVRGKIAKAINSERESWVAWFSLVEALVGTPANLEACGGWTKLKENLIEAVDCASNAGWVGGDLRADELRSRIRQFNSNGFDEVFAQASRIREFDKNNSGVLQSLSKADPLLRDNCVMELRVIEKFLSGTKGELKRRLETMQTAVEIEASVGNILATLAKLNRFATSSRKVGQA